MKTVGLDELKDKCLKAFKYTPQLEDIIKNLAENKLNTARVLMDDAMEELQAVINQPIGPDESGIHNGRIIALSDMLMCWQDLVELILNEVAEHERKTRLLQSSGDK
jgi:hypothetical protein